MIKSRTSRLLAEVLLAGGLALSGIRAAESLPCFLADNHAETFGWISRTVDLDRAHALVLVDAHSDANAAERSDEIREGLRRVVSRDERARRIRGWRADGRIQAFNWIEPLMPRPLARVRWLAAPALEKQRAGELRSQAAALLDGRLEVEPRDGGRLGERFSVEDFSMLAPPLDGPVILAIDLDFFAGMSAEDREKAFDRLWTRAMTWPGLKGVAFAVSRPWLGDDGEADALVRMAVGAVCRTRGATLEMELGEDHTPDDSRRAHGLAVAGKPVPRWSGGHASPALRCQLAAWRGVLRLHGADAEGWLTPPPVIRPDAGAMDCDGIWRYPLGQAPVLRTTMPAGASGRVRWFVHEPAHEAVDLWHHTGLGKDFALHPAARVYERRRDLGGSADFALAPARWAPVDGGRVRLQAEVETPAGWLPTPLLEIRLAAAKGFRGSLSECRGMPYAFGIASVREGHLAAVETGWGADCSNLLIHAWRRQGHLLTWGDPQDLRKQLEILAPRRGLDDRVPITADQIERGLAIDFGSHVAAVWEDRPPIGVLDGNDLVFHHLGGFPQTVMLGELAAGRPGFNLLAPRMPPSVDFKAAGDVVLAGDDLRRMEGFEKGDAACLMVNLEGVPSLSTAAEGLRHDFRFPPARLQLLKDAGVDVVSMANNHAGDAGPAGLLEGIHALGQLGIAVVGAGKDRDAACSPWRVAKDGLVLACFGVSVVDAMVAGRATPGVAKLPEHRQLLGERIRAARAAGDQVVIMVHWGREYSGKVDADQREWAQWLVDQGASLVLGAHPHVVQRREVHGGAVIVHSLGNAVYPAALKGRDSGLMVRIALPGGGQSR